MKKSLVVFVCATLGCSGPLSFSALAPVSALSSADQAWMVLQAPMPAMAPVSTLATGQTVDPAEVKSAMALRAAAFVAQADQAKDFQTQFPEHAKVGDAKLLEVRGLVSAVQMGDATVEGRLAAAVQALRANSSIPGAVQVQGVAAYEFSRQTRGLRTLSEQLKAMEQVARELARDFPDQPQGFESLFYVAVTDRDETNAKKIAADLLAMPAPAALKMDARKLLDRFALVGKPLDAELQGANELAAKASLAAGRPTIVYTWSKGNPGSLALAADLKKRGLTANVIGLNVDTDPKAAAATAETQGMIGSLVYDGRGKEGALAQRLKVRNSSEVFLVDAQGVIREVRAQSDLSNALQRVGL